MSDILVERRGADISEFTENRKDTEGSLAYQRETQAAYEAMRDCPKPTVAMVFGYCMILFSARTRAFLEKRPPRFTGR